MIKPAQVQIQIVTWNSKERLPGLFAGIRGQTVDYDLVVVDNGSSDGTVEWLEEYSAHGAPHLGPLPKGEGVLRIIANKENRGFAAGHNQGFAICRAPFVLALNPDVELGGSFLERCLAIIQSDERIGAVAGKLYRRLPQAPPLNPPLDKGGRWGGIIDSCGLAIKPWGQIINIGEGQPDRGQFDNFLTIFGVSGAAAFYRLEALKSVADRYGIFDERFGTYKEDADLAWRLQRAGWKTIFVPGAAALHPRAVRHDNRDSRGDIINQLSLRNHLLTLKKNLSWRDWPRMPLIAGYELAKFIYVLLFERHNLKAYGSIHHHPQLQR